MTPQIIRNLAELEALDSESIVQRYDQQIRPEHAWSLAYIVSRKRWGGYFPAVVIATGDQVRAARKALEDA